MCARRGGFAPEPVERRKTLVIRRVSWATAASFGLGWVLAMPAPAGDAIVLDLPLQCALGTTCAIQQYVDHDPSPAARDYQCGTLSYDGHNGTDFRLPTLAAQRAGVNVLAAANGVVARVRDQMQDVSIAASGVVAVGNRMCGNGVIVTHRDGWETQYCHLEKDSVRVRPGQGVVAGTPLGRVGLSGATVFPHLHFTVRHHGAIVDPFAFGAAADSCGGGVPLWRASLRAALRYRAREVLNAGFSAAPVSMDAVEAGDGIELKPDSADPAAIVAYVRSIGLKAGDVQQLLIRAPDGSVVLEHAANRLERNQAQSLLFAGKARPAGGWPGGRYWATYRVLLDGQVVLEHSFSVPLAAPQRP
jgi:murein DD-endopeptidase MepM/ murein hydrolase activator NlpD